MDGYKPWIGGSRIEMQEWGWYYELVRTKFSADPFKQRYNYHTALLF